MKMDRDRMEEAVRSFLDALGVELDDDVAAATPGRVTRAWAEDLLSGYALDPERELTWAPNDAGPEAGPVVVRAIRFASVCAHHLLPFHGMAGVAYLPHERIAGLSKLARVVDAHARRLQTQERLTAAIVATLDRSLRPRGAMAVLRAEHTCMSLRGVRKEQASMVTLASSGAYRDDVGARREILDLLAVERAR
jgi:GTP cyclohydrolase I